MRQYPNHACDCDDTDLSQTEAMGVLPGGLRMLITCGEGHQRAVPRERWEAELARRRAARARAKSGGEDV